VEALVPAGSANMLEAICAYLRTEVAQPVLQEHTDRFIKYIWSVFFFVLTVNILGLLPIPVVSNLFGTHLGGTATGNIWMTATLAITTMFMMVVNGLRIGGKAYLAHFCPGPIWLAPLLVPVEIIGLIAKVFALAVRLFANMIAGHILLAVLLSFIMSAGSVSTGLGLGVGVRGGHGIGSDQPAGTLRRVSAGFHFYVPDNIVYQHVGRAAPRRSPRGCARTWSYEALIRFSKVAMPARFGANAGREA
jgi:ATP synthase subunit 6